MSFIMIPEELLEVDLSAAQFRMLIHIINNTYSSGKYAGCCCLGYQNLADLCFTHKGAAINTVKQLEQLGFIEVNRRERFNRSNAIKITLEKGYERCRNISGDISGNTSERSLKHTDERSLNHTLGSLNRTKGSLNRTAYIDLKFKNQDLKINARAKRYLNRTFDFNDENNQTAPADEAAGRSMPKEESSRGIAASAAAVNEHDRNLLAAMKAQFTDIFADLSLSKTENTYILRKKGKYALIEDMRLREVACWLCTRGLDARIMDTQTRVLGEVLLEEVA